MAYNATYTPIFELNGIDDKTPSTTRKVHIRRLNDILHLSLERGDLPRARRAWTILVRCKEFDWKSKWRIGLLLLSDSSFSHQSRHENRNIHYLKKLMRHYPDEQESLLQEIMLQLADMGKFKDALDELDFYLPSFPFQENPVLISYAGLLTLRLATSSEVKNQYLGDFHLLSEAQKHFAKALAIGPDNIVVTTFMKEVENWVERSKSGSPKPLDDLQSDGDMDVDYTHLSLRGKRMKRTTGED